MELTEAIRRRRMVRSFAADPLDRDVVDGILQAALRAPSAGNTRGVAWLVLEGAETASYWEHTTDESWRAAYERYPRMSRAPVIALSLCSPTAYVERYGEPDKATSGLGPTDADGGLVCPLLVGRRCLHDDARPAGRDRSRPRSGIPRGVPRRGRAARRPRGSGRLEALWRRVAGQARRPGPPVPLARSVARCRCWRRAPITLVVPRRCYEPKPPKIPFPRRPSQNSRS